MFVSEAVSVRVIDLDEDTSAEGRRVTVDVLPSPLAVGVTLRDALGGGVGVCDTDVISDGVGV